LGEGGVRVRSIANARTAFFFVRLRLTKKRNISNTFGLTVTASLTLTLSQREREQAAID